MWGRGWEVIWTYMAKHKKGYTVYIFQRSYSPNATQLIRRNLCSRVWLMFRLNLNLKIILIFISMPRHHHWPCGALHGGIVRQSRQDKPHGGLVPQGADTRESWWLCFQPLKHFSHDKLLRLQIWVSGTHTNPPQLLWATLIYPGSLLIVARGVVGHVRNILPSKEPATRTLDIT